MLIYLKYVCSILLLKLINSIKLKTSLNQLFNFIWSFHTLLIIINFSFGIKTFIPQNKSIEYA